MEPACFISAPIQPCTRIHPCFPTIAQQGMSPLHVVRYVECDPELPNLAPEGHVTGIGVQVTTCQTKNKSVKVSRYIKTFPNMKDREAI